MPKPRKSKDGAAEIGCFLYIDTSDTEKCCNFVGVFGLKTEAVNDSPVRPDKPVMDEKQCRRHSNADSIRIP